jgi:NADH:ubiquinone oxidoreductase subunit C
LGYVQGVLNHSNLTRLLTDYGFQVILRKDFPLSGFTESRYNVIKNRVVYENIASSRVQNI